MFIAVTVFSQNTNPDSPTVKIDSLYREDQFYFGFTLNTLQNKPAGLIQNKFSSGFTVGFLRDLPVNKKRTLAIAPGIGVSYNSYNQNIAISQVNQTSVYTIVSPDTTYDKNRFTQLLAEVPIEFRWRTSTYESHKFWRFYGGFKMGYLIYDKAIYQDNQGKIVVTNNNDYTKFQYGTYISVGYHSITIYAYYGLNLLFKSARTTTKSIDRNALNIAVIFYVL